jgi:pimeloyl-ACP methyl ester carboxylesterase
MARFVLVHGAFSGAWIWGPLIDHLKAAGHSVDAFHFPGLGDDDTPVSEVTLDGCAVRLCEVLATNSEPAIVVGNSMGGVIATQGAARCPERVAALVYVSAFLPKDGQSLLALTKLPEGAGDQVQANITIEGDPPVAVMPAGFASRVIRFLYGGRRGLGDRTAAPATNRTVRYASFHTARSSGRYQPVLRAMHAGSGYPSAVAAADDCRERMRRGH